MNNAINIYQFQETRSAQEYKVTQEYKVYQEYKVTQEYEIEKTIQAEINCYEGVREIHTTVKGPPSTFAIILRKAAERMATEHPSGTWVPGTPYKNMGGGYDPNLMRGLSCDCSGDYYSCENFESQKEAQDCLEKCNEKGFGDIHNLDCDNDRIACELLP